MGSRVTLPCSSENSVVVVVVVWGSKVEQKVQQVEINKTQSMTTAK
jgi:hypothetical protein